MVIAILPIGGADVATPTARMDWTSRIVSYLESFRPPADDNTVPTVSIDTCWPDMGSDLNN